MVGRLRVRSESVGNNTEYRSRLHFEAWETLSARASLYQVRKTLGLERHDVVIDSVTTKKCNREMEAVRPRPESPTRAEETLELRRTHDGNYGLPRLSEICLAPCGWSQARQPQNAPLGCKPHHRRFTKRPCRRHACVAAASKLYHLTNFLLLAVVVLFLCRLF